MSCFILNYECQVLYQNSYQCLPKSFSLRHHQVPAGDGAGLLQNARDGEGRAVQHGEAALPPGARVSSALSGGGPSQLTERVFF